MGILTLICRWPCDCLPLNRCTRFLVWNVSHTTILKVVTWEQLRRDRIHLVTRLIHQVVFRFFYMFFADCPILTRSLLSSRRKENQRRLWRHWVKASRDNWRPCTQQNNCLTRNFHLSVDIQIRKIILKYTHTHLKNKISSLILFSLSSYIFSSIYTAIMKKKSKINKKKQKQA